MTRVLAIDLGGTKTALALYEAADGALVRTTTVASASAPGIEPIIEAFLDGDRVVSAALGVAGPVRDGVCRTTNLPWVVATDSLARLLGTKRVTLMNDVEAACFGARVVPEAHRHVLRAAERDPDAPTALVMIGTGFGRAMLAHGRAYASEGGHVTFAARTAREQALRAHLAALHATSHVSVEHVLSGRGVLDVHGFVTRDHAGATAPANATELADLARAGDAAARETVAWLASIIGATLGDVALQTLPRGGLCLSGGVVLGLGALLHGAEFDEAFLEKGPMRPLLETIPVERLDTAGLGLLGAKAVALETAP